MNTNTTPNKFSVKAAQLNKLSEFVKDIENCIIVNKSERDEILAKPEDERNYWWRESVLNCNTNIEAYETLIDRLEKLL